MLGNLWAVGFAAGAAIVALSIIIFFVNRYQRCPANKVLVISGKVGDGQGARCLSGGGAFIWPIVQQYAFLDLTPMSLDVPLTDALSFENIRVAVPATVTVAISREPDAMQNAAARLLGLSESDISNLAKDLILGQMRQVIAGMKIEEINKDRDAFLKKIDSSLEPELKKVGLSPINVNIRDIKDASGYIEATGRKAAAQAVQTANADVADQEKAGAVRVAEAKQEQLVKVAEANRTQQIGVKAAEKDQAIQVADYNREQTVSVSANEAASAEGQAAAAVRRAEAKRLAESAQAQADAAIEVARNDAQTTAALANAKRIEAEQTAQLVSTARAAAEKLVVEAEADRKSKELRAQGDYAATFQKLKAEADGQLAILTARAQGMKLLVQAAGGSEAAYRLLLVDHIDHVADASANAIKGLKFDKVVVWGGANGQEIPNFLTGLVKGIPPLMDVLAQVANVTLPGAPKEDAPAPSSSEEVTTK